jgi:hypothetical protein
MATIPIATIIPGPKYTLTPAGATAANGLFMLGNTDPDNTRVGAYAIEFRMSPDWVGEIGILARNGVHKAGVDDIALLGPWPFRAFYLNGSGWDGSMVSSVAGVTPTITGTSSIIVPGYGQTIGLGVTCTAGSCTLYYLPVLGQSVV